MKQIVQDNIWKDRISSANRYYDQWAHLFKCDALDQYYEGFQWKSQKNLDFEPYTINKFFETIQIKVAEFVPTFIKFLVSARPASSQYDLESAAQSAQLKEDTLNTLVWNDFLSFHDEVEMAYIDSFMRFGIVEVGYSADWVVNPNAPKPLFNKDTDKNLSNRHGVREQPRMLPTAERVYFKHIGAKRFRVFGMDHKYLHRCSAVGYYEWVNKEELLSLKIMNRDKVESATASHASTETFDYSDKSNKPDSLKIWHIWDQRSNQRLVVLDSPCVTVFQTKFTRLPLFDFRPTRRISTEGFYPVPPSFHWLSPQNELNEIRDQLRNHRRRFVSKYQVTEGAIDDEELEKFETGADGALVKVKREGAIAPIDAPNLGNALNSAEVTSSDDLNQISGTSSEVRGVADRTTATQANIVNQRSSIREQKERDRFVAWLGRIGRETLLICRDKFTLGVWAELSSQENFLGPVQQNNSFGYVSHEDLNDGYDFKINIDVTSLSATAQTEEKQKFIEFLTLSSQFPQIAMSPKLIREAAYRVGYRNESVIQEMQKMSLLLQMGHMQQLQQAGGAGLSQQVNQQQMPPNLEQARNQMQNQLGQTR